MFHGNAGTGIAGLFGEANAGYGTSRPARVAGIRLPKANDGFMGYPQNNTVKRLARTRTLNFLFAREVEQIPCLCQRNFNMLSGSFLAKGEQERLTHPPNRLAAAAKKADAN
jgi:hypothetical protein